MIVDSSDQLGVHSVAMLGLDSASLFYYIELLFLCKRSLFLMGRNVLVAPPYMYLLPLYLATPTSSRGMISLWANFTLLTTH